MTTSSAAPRSSILPDEDERTSDDALPRGVEPPARTPAPPRRSYVGVVSLLVAVVGAVGCRAALALDPGPDPMWLRVLAAGFEAAMVGGIADWFAVTALFRHPLGIPIPHTALVVERRDKLVDGIVDTVQDEWLSPEVIGAKLAMFAPSDILLDWLRDPEHLHRVGAPLRDLLRTNASFLTEPELANFAERNIRGAVARFPMNRAVAWLASASASPSAQAAFTSLAVSLANLADRPRTAEDLRFWLERSARTLQAGGKRLVPMLLRRRLVQRKLVEAICSYVAAEMRAAAEDEDHPLRRTAFDALASFAERIDAGDAEALQQAEAFRAAIVESLSSGTFVREILAQLRRQLEDDLGSDASALSEFVSRRLRTTVVDWLDDPAHREQFDRWVRTMSEELLRRHHHQIGRTVRDYLEQLDDAELVERIEARVGADLQYIRLNGAVIGGLVGVVLALLHVLFGGG
jgi:uncharacterized membrane-anchored protein YjiN (DUF445 family)